MKFKKLLSLALAGVMTLSLATPALAADEDNPTNTTDITATYSAPVISVVVPKTAAAFINPLGLPVKVDATNNISISGQILTAPMALKNKSEVDLQVGAVMTAEVNEGSDMRFTTTPTGGTGATKNAFAYLQAKQATDLTGAAVTDAAIATAYGEWEASDYNAETDMVVNTTLETKKDNLVVLRAANVTNGAFAAYKAGSIALVRLAGDCVATPTTASWTATKTENGVTTGDGFKVSVAYTFKTAAITKYDITVSEITYGGTIDTGATVTASEVKAAAGDTVTLNVVSPAGAALTISATTPKADGSGTDPVALTHDTTNANVSASSGSVVVNGLKNGETGGPAATTTTITFTMPAGGVTITAAVADRT